MASILDRPASTPPWTDKHPSKAFPECWTVTKEVRSRRRRWARRAAWQRRWSRATGLLVILLGIGLPVLATLDFRYQPLAVSATSLAIAGLVALRSVYRWDRLGQSLRGGELALANALERWECDLSRYAYEDDGPSARQAAFKRTQELLGEVRRTTRVGAEACCGGLDWPDAR
jgi:hypothetical protein